jgi:antitoxin component of RelBE/YafQ-DinJ toxin-antitoxin module
MTRGKTKVDWIGARTDEDFKELVEAYIDEADMTMGQLIRKAVEEYIKLHPVKEDK